MVNHWNADIISIIFYQFANDIGGERVLGESLDILDDMLTEINQLVVIIVFKQFYDDVVAILLKADLVDIG